MARICLGGFAQEKTKDFLTAVFNQSIYLQHIPQRLSARLLSRSRGLLYALFLFRSASPPDSV
jgi:hypothetical protein